MQSALEFRTTSVISTWIYLPVCYCYGNNKPESRELKDYEVIIFGFVSWMKMKLLKSDYVK